MTSMQRMVAAVLLIGVVTLSAVLIAHKIFGRNGIDLTDQGIYTLSQGTQNIVAKLNQNVSFKLFYSRTAALKGPEGIRFFNNYYTYIKELLEEYVGLSGGKLSLEVIDPRAYSEEEDEAVRYGLERRNISEEESFIFGLAAVSEMGKEAAIPLFSPSRQELIEYDISKLILQVTQREMRKIGVISSLPVAGSNLSPYEMQMLQMQGRGMPQPWTIISHLREFYDVVNISNPVDKIEPDVDFLLVIHPKNLSQKTLFAIDQFVMGGGKLLVFTDPFCFSDQPPQNPQNPMAAMSYDTSSNLNELLKNWGVEMESGVIAADHAFAIRASVRRNAPPTPIITFLQLTDEGFNSDEIISAELHNVRMLFAGALKKVEGTEATIVPIVSTTKTGNTWKPSSMFEIQQFNPEAVMRAVPDGEEPVMLACRISGKLRTNFPDGPLESGEEPEEENPEGEDGEDQQEEEPEPALLTESAPEASVVVFADVDFISDSLAYQQSIFGVETSGDNAALVLNTIDFLSGSGDLITIRSRGRFQRPFEVVDRIESETEQATATQVDAINKKISDYQQRLNELGNVATDENVELIQNTAIAERNRIQEEIRKARKELRQLNARRRENIEALGALLQTINMVGAPLVVAIFAIFLAVARFNRAKKYAAGRTQE